MSPIAEKLRIWAAPTFPTSAGPVLRPTRNRGRVVGRGQAANRPLHRQRGARRTQRVIRLRVRGVEDGHERVADELDHRPGFVEDDGHGRPEGCVQHRHDLTRVTRAPNTPCSRAGPRTAPSPRPPLRRVPPVPGPRSRWWPHPVRGTGAAGGPRARGERSRACPGRTPPAGIPQGCRRPRMPRQRSRPPRRPGAPTVIRGRS